MRQPLRSSPLVLPLLLTLGCTVGKDGDPFFSTYFVTLTTPAADVADTAAALSDEFGFDLINVYDSVGNGFSMVLPDVVVPELEKVTVVKEIRLDDPDDFTDPVDPDEDFEVGPDETPVGITRIGGPFASPSFLDGLEVAVIDTGVQGDHPDLNVVAHEDIVGRHTGDEADGTDPVGHGTHVSGTIGAIANGTGVVGVAPGVAIHDVRVLGSDGSGYMSDIIAGLEYVADHPEIRVVNMSLGGPSGSSFDDDMADALDKLAELGVVVCIAAGNEAQNTRNVVPAGLDRGVVVSAYNTRGGTDRGFADFSNFGDAVDVTAPGVSIYSTWPDGGYEALDGTSMATPHVAGVAAVYMALNPDKSASQVRTALVNNGEGGLEGANGDHPEPMVDLSALVD